MLFRKLISLSRIGADKDVSSTKVDPLSSEVKYNKQAEAPQDRGVVGTDEAIDQARVDPVGGRGKHRSFNNCPGRRDGS